jgi:AAA domain-containing protein
VTDLLFTALEEFAAADEQGADPIGRAADGGAAIPADGDIVVYGDGGAGKTTLTFDLCFTLAAGGSWLGLVDANRPLRIAIIENEGPRPMLRRKLESKLKASGANLEGRIVVLEEPWGELTFANSEHLSALAHAVTELELDLLVIGPLISAGEFPNGGTPTEVARFEEHEKQLRRLLDRPLTILLVHHENQAGRISGAWGRFGDTHLHVTAQGNGRTRLFWSKVRWSSVLHKTTSQLLWADGETFTLDTKPEITDDTMRTELLDAVRNYPGSSWTKIRELHNNDGTKRVRGNLTELQTLRDTLLAEGALRNLAAREGSFELWIADDPTATRSDAGTAPERPAFSPPASEEEPTRSAVPLVRENGYGNGTDHPEPETLTDYLNWR